MFYFYSEWQTCFLLPKFFIILKVIEMRRRRPRVSIAPVPDMTQSLPMEESLYKKFKTFMTTQKTSLFSQKLHEYFGKNFAINYKPTFNFREEWESTTTKVQRQNDSENIWKINEFSSFVLIFIMVFYTVGIWSRNIQCFFSDNPKKEWLTRINIILLLLQIPDGTMKVLILHSSNGKQLSFAQFIKSTVTNIYNIAYLLPIVLGANKYSFFGWWIFELPLLFFLYLRAKGIYESLRLTNFGLSNENYLKTLDMIFTLLMIAHGIAIALYQVTKLGFQQTWINNMDLVANDQLARYIYSFYFGTSTIFTVGYGDLSPRNQAEVVVVIVVQSVGVIIMGYIINEIGYNLSAIRNGRQELEKQLALMNKMKRYYKTDEQLFDRARSYIIKEKPSVDYLVPEQQTRLLAKFNEDLRNEIKHESSMAIIKSCIFFLCRWSKSMQNLAATKLNNIMFSHSDHIYQPEGKERIYIIRLGKVQVYAKRKGNKRTNRHILKTIVNDLNKQVSDNSYGYTAVISSRPVRINAIASESTSAYYLEKQKFLQCVNERVTDFEYFHEVKDRIDLAQNWEALEVPQLQNSKHHYNPTHSQLIKKHNSRMGIGHNQRRPLYKRLLKRKEKMNVQNYKDCTTFVCPSVENILQDSLDSNLPERYQRQSVSDQSYLYDERQIKIQTNEKVKTIIENHFKKKQSTKFINSTDYDIENIKLISQLSQKMSNQGIKELLTIDIGQQYTNYFPKCNRSQVLKNMELSEYMRGNIQLAYLVNSDLNSLVKSIMKREKNVKPLQSSQPKLSSSNLISSATSRYKL